MKGKSVKKAVSGVITAVLVLAGALLLGMLIGRFINDFGLFDGLDGLSAPMLILILVGLAAAYLVIYLIEIAIHEAGHLVFGLLSGYSFVSYRIGSFMILKRDGRLLLKRFSLAGTGGQCLMSPPDMKDGKFPQLAYNLGGVIMNLVSVGIFALLLIPFRGHRILPVFFFFGILDGLIMALMNGVPLNIGAAPNDGWNALHIGDDPYALRAFWTMLRVNALQQEGVRLRDLPEEWFEAPPSEELKNGITASHAVSIENRMMDAHDLDSARALIPPLISDECGAPGIHKALLSCDMVYCDLIKCAAEADVSPLSRKDTAAVLRSMKDYPSVLRTKYAVALLKNGDEAEAASVMERFEKTAKTHPYPAEIESESELMSIARERADTEKPSPAGT